MAFEQVVEEVIGAIHRMDPIPEDVLAVRQALQRYPEGDWPAIAEGARDAWKREVASGGNASRALRAALAASMVYAIAGDDAGSLRADYDAVQIRFLAANDVFAYGAVRRDAAALAAQARAQGLAALAFDAATTAADSAYFAVECADDAQRGTILGALLPDLLAAVDAAQRCPDCPTADSAGFARFVSLVAVASETLDESVITRQMPGAWQPDGTLAPEFTDAMRRFAAGVEAVVPDDFVFVQNGEEDAEKSAQIAERLARLSSRHGSAARAKARLRASLARGTGEDA